MGLHSHSDIIIATPTGSLRCGDWVDHPLPDGTRGRGVMVGFMGAPGDPILMIRRTDQPLHYMAPLSACVPLPQLERITLFDDGPTPIPPIGRLARALITAAILLSAGTAFAAEPLRCVVDPNLQAWVCPPGMTPPAAPPPSSPKPDPEFAGAFGGRGRIL